jgi:hypothetical protein
VRQRGAVEVEAALAFEILGRDPAVVLADELLRLCGIRLRQMLAEPGANAVYQGLIERCRASLRRGDGRAERWEVAAQVRRVDLEEIHRLGQPPESPSAEAPQVDALCH